MAKPKMQKKKNPVELIEPDPTVKRPLILFSGGFDSTYLLQETLKTEDCDVLSIKCGQSSLKNIQEHLAREKIKSLLKDCGLKGRIVNTYTSEFQLIDHATFAQAPAWIFGAIQHVNPEIHSEVKIGYVLGDQISAFLVDIVTAWNALIRIAKFVDVPISFPLYIVTKNHIYANLDRRLFEHTWVCELPVVRGGEVLRCGKCAACNTYENTIRILNKDAIEPFVYTKSEFDLQTEAANQVKDRASSYEITKKKKKRKNPPIKR